MKYGQKWERERFWIEDAKLFPVIGSLVYTSQFTISFSDTFLPIRWRRKRKLATTFGWSYFVHTRIGNQFVDCNTAVCVLRKVGPWARVARVQNAVNSTASRINRNLFCYVELFAWYLLQKSMSARSIPTSFLLVQQFYIRNGYM